MAKAKKRAKTAARPKPSPASNASAGPGLIATDLLHARPRLPEPAPILAAAHLKEHHERKAAEEKHVERKPLGARLRGFLLRPDKPAPAQAPKELPTLHAQPHAGVPPAETTSLAERFAARKRAQDLLGPLQKKAERPVDKPIEQPTAKPLPEPKTKPAPEPKRPEPPHTAPKKQEPPVERHHTKAEPAQGPAKESAKESPKPKPISFRPQKIEKPKGPRKRLQRRSLQEYLDKAGFEVSAEKVRRRTWQGLIVVFLLLSAYVLVEASLWGTGPLDIIIFMAGLWSAGFAAAFLAAQGAIYFFLDYRVYKRTREIEVYLPDFLQLASSNIAAGMPIDRALWFSIRPSFGVLAREMQEVAKATMAGEDLETSLTRFAERYESATLRRSVSILIEGLRAGGEMADLLNKIALNIEEIKIMKEEMAANVTTYAIFITFASVIVAPFLFALATQLLEIIIGITGRLDLSSSGGFFSLNAADPTVIGRFKTFSIVMLAISTSFSAALVSVIKRGNVLEGIKSIPVYAIGSVIIYYIGLAVLHSAFGGILAG